jgi:ligand-binding SRPBCC domain-containing protein
MKSVAVDSGAMSASSSLLSKVLSRTAARPSQQYGADGGVDAVIEHRMRAGSTFLDPWWLLTQTQHVPRPLDEVFEFFSNAENLETLTPSFLGFEIQSRTPIQMGVGSRIAYRLRLCGIGVRWLTGIECWNPPESFVDVQLRGPYRRWRHHHHFQTAPDGGTIMTDRVEIQLPFGPLGIVAYYAFVRKMLTEIFTYRAAVLDRLSRYARFRDPAVTE